MDRFDELADCIYKKVERNRDKLNSIITEMQEVNLERVGITNEIYNAIKSESKGIDKLINRESDSIDDLVSLGCKFKSYYDDFCVYNSTYKRMMLNEDRVREMLNGFYDNGTILLSLIYQDIERVEPKTLQYSEGYRYKSAKRFFKTLDEAKDYEMSFGIDKYWCPNIMNNILDFNDYISLATIDRDIEIANDKRYKEANIKGVER